MSLTHDPMRAPFRNVRAFTEQDGLPGNPGVTYDDIGGM